MVVTDRFVYIHSPKSGGTFVTAMLTTAASRIDGFSADNLVSLKHAGVRCIPEEFRHLPVVTNKRNVFSHYVSRYRYRWWAVEKRARKVLDFDRVKADYPSFPELSFSEYLRFVNHWPYRLNIKPRLRRLLEDREIGYNTWELVRLTRQKPTATLHTFDDIPAEQLRDEYSRIHFLRTESLNRDLVELLVATGLARDEVAFILDTGTVIPRPAERLSARAWLGYLSSLLPGRRVASNNQTGAVRAPDVLSLYSYEDLEFVLRRDRFYFTVFPEMRPQQP